jgi:hypothetical protein
VACRDLDRLLGAYLDGEPDAAESASLRAIIS